MYFKKMGPTVIHAKTMEKLEKNEEKTKSPNIRQEELITSNGIN